MEIASGNYVTRFLEEFKEGRVNLDVTEKGYDNLSVQMLPNLFSILTLGITILWVLLYLGLALYESFFEGLWLELLVIPGLMVAFLISSFYPLSIVFSLILLASSFFLFPHWLFNGTIGFYALTSLVKRISRWYVVDLIKRHALANNKNFLLALRKKIIKISASKYATKKTLGLLNEISKE